VPWLRHKTKIVYPFVGKHPKAQHPYCGPMTDRPLTEELKCSRNRAQRHQRPTNNMLEVWQNSASFSGRPICGAIEALLTKIVNRQMSVVLIVVFIVAAAVSVS
jgi:hypothetical protein